MMPPIPCRNLQDALNATWPDLGWWVGLGGRTLYRLVVDDGAGRRHFMLAPFAVLEHHNPAEQTPRALALINAATRVCIAKANAA